MKTYITNVMANPNWPYKYYAKNINYQEKREKKMKNEIEIKRTI